MVGSVALRAVDGARVDQLRRVRRNVGDICAGVAAFALLPPEVLDPVLAVAEAELDRGEGIPHAELKRQIEAEGERMRKELGL